MISVELINRSVCEKNVFTNAVTHMHFVSALSQFSMRATWVSTSYGCKCVTLNK